MARRLLRPSRKINSNPDPLSGAPKEGAFAEPIPHKERGTVIDVDATRHIYRVALNSGRVLNMGRLKSHPGDMSLLSNGTMVRVDFALGLPYIDGILPLETAAPDLSQENPVSITGVPSFGGEDPAYNRNYGATARADGEPRDVMPGDFAGISDDGAAVAALHGKVALIKGSELAQVQAFGDTDTVQIIAGNLRTITWMGESRIENNDGKTSFVWRGGADQLTQTGADEEKYPIRLDVGQTGNLLKLEITNTSGQALFSLHVDPNGKCSLFAAGGFDQQAGRDKKQVHPLRLHGSEDVQIEGDSTRRVAGDSSIRIESASKFEVSNNHSEFVGQDRVSQVNREDRLNVGGNRTELITGKRRLVTQGDCETEVRPGGIHAVKTNGGAMNFDTLGGTITMKTTNAPVVVNPGTSRIELNATSADAIVLGLNSVQHAMIYEPTQTVLALLTQRINLIGALVATHFHTSFGTPSLTLGPIAGPIAPNLLACKSIRVKLT